MSVIADYPHRMGGHCGSGALRDLLEHQRLGWAGPPREGLVFTLGGSLAFTYLRSDLLRPPIYLVGRGSELELYLVTRLGGQVTTRTTDDPVEGWQWVRDELDDGRPVMAWADIGELPYLRVRLQMSRHDIVIIGYDDAAQTAMVVDNDRAEVQHVPYDALARARSSKAFPEPTRHLVYDIDWPSTLPELRTVAGDAFAAHARNMTSGGLLAIAGASDDTVETGLQAVDRFAADLEQWPQLFDEPTLDLTLRSLRAFIEKAGTGGGLFRRLLADGCHDLADQLPDPTLPPLAAAAAAAHDGWSALAAAASSTSDAASRAAEVAALGEALPRLERELVEALSRSAAALGATGGSHSL